VAKLHHYVELIRCYRSKLPRMKGTLHTFSIFSNFAKTYQLMDFIETIHHLKRGLTKNWLEWMWYGLRSVSMCNIIFLQF